MNKTQHFITVAELNKEAIATLLDRAQALIDNNQHSHAILTTLTDKTVANLFFETSTRTQISFELSAKRLGATVINVNINNSSLKKGETLLDTLQTLHAMNCEIVILRHSDDDTIANLAKQLPQGPALINAGSGCFSHPSQALLDMLTIRQHKQRFSDLRCAIVGDIKHSRVARSQIAALQTLGAKEIRLIAPTELQAHNIATENVTLCTDLSSGLSDIDVILLLRVQKERMETLLDSNAYHSSFGLTHEKLTLAKPDALVMHPGPVNRDVEISGALADDCQAVFLQQVNNGIAIRMAILEMVCKEERP